MHLSITVCLWNILINLRDLLNWFKLISIAFEFMLWFCSFMFRTALFCLLSQRDVGIHIWVMKGLLGRTSVAHLRSTLVSRCVRTILNCKTRSYSHIFEIVHVRPLMRLLPWLESSFKAYISSLYSGWWNSSVSFAHLLVSLRWYLHGSVLCDSARMLCQLSIKLIKDLLIVFYSFPSCVVIIRQNVVSFSWACYSRALLISALSFDFRSFLLLPWAFSSLSNHNHRIVKFFYRTDSIIRSYILWIPWSLCISVVRISHRMFRDHFYWNQIWFT